MLVASHVQAEAQSIDRARQLYLDADFEGARDAFDRTLSQPDLDVSDAVEAHRHLVTLSLLLGDADGARLHAEAAVALDPDAEAPPGSPAEAQALLTGSHRDMGGPATLTLRADGDTSPGALLEVEATLAPAPELLAAALRLACESGGEEIEERGRPPTVQVEIEVVGEVRCEAEALAPGGAALLAADQAFGEPRPETDHEEGAAIWPWVAAGAGVAIVAGVVALVLISGSSADQATLGSPRVEGW